MERHGTMAAWDDLVGGLAGVWSSAIDGTPDADWFNVDHTSEVLYRIKNFPEANDDVADTGLQWTLVPGG